MIRVSVEICSQATSFRADISAESLVQAIGLANSCYPGYEVRVLFPIDGDAFFTRELAPVAGMISPQRLEAVG